ncbi:MAG TPA: flavin reductase family protein [Bacteroidia bacterium]|nr:flavin reductase family protein [Bacteroidia bacterium]
MLTIDPKAIKTGLLHAHMLSAVAPRPIAFASTIDKEGRPNLSPYSFFNAFGSNPPTLIFSPARRVRDNTIKHTLENVYETMEVVINVVNFAMVQQMSLASHEFPKGVSEFEKAGFTPIPSQKVKPFRVKESPVQFECVVKQVIETGESGGAGNLIICEIVLMHINENVLDSEGRIDPNLIDLVARCGYHWYCRASGPALFEVTKPNLKLCIGMDQIPESIRNSEILTGNELGVLGNEEHFPTEEEILAFAKMEEIQSLATELRNNPATAKTALHLAARELIRAKKVADAWKLLLMKID